MNGISVNPGEPGSFPLPNPGSQGTSFAQNKMHPAAIAAAQPRTNPMNAGAPLMAPMVKR